MRDIEEIRYLIAEVKEYLVSQYSGKIKKVIIYGSFARGKATDDSDIDVAIVVADELNNRELERSLEDLLFRIVEEKQELISVVILTESHFNGYNSPFILNTRKEGVNI